MALLDAGLHPNQFVIDAVDISAYALRIARNGRYGRNSFRQKDLGFRDRYFAAVKERYELIEEVRACVQFQQANLLAPDFLAGVAPYDVIFCRNVLIYFDVPTQALVLKTLDRLLDTSGFLFVGPSEAFVTRGSGLAPAQYPHAFAYQKPAVRAAPRPEKPPVRKAPRLLPPRVAPQRRVTVEQVTPPPIPTVDLETAAKLADAGRLVEAASACESHLRDHGASAAGYCLLGVVRDALGDHSQAAALYRKALYLEPGHAEALAHLALLAAKSGDAAGAKRLQLRAERVAAISSSSSDLRTTTRTRTRTKTRTIPE